MSADAYGRKAGEVLQRIRIVARLEQEGLAARVRALGANATASDVDEWECRGDYPAWVLMMLYDMAGLSPEHIVALLNHPQALFRRAYGLISGDAQHI